jgi:hypothetical protein
MTHTQTQDNSMTQAHTGTKAYRLAREGAWQIEPFGPMLTLEQAQKYQADMALANVSVLVINSKAV